METTGRAAQNGRTGTTKRERGIYFRPRKFGTERVGKQRGEWWIAYVSEYGQLHREKVGPRGQAILAYQERKRDIRLGQFFPEQLRARPVLFEQLAEDFLKTAETNEKRSLSSDRTRMRRLLAAFEGHPAAAISAEAIEKLKADLQAEDLRTAHQIKAGEGVKRMAPATVNRHLALLRSVFYLALRNKKITTHPMHGVKFFRENNVRVRYLTEEEEFRLFQQLKACYHAIVRIGLLTGLRASNLLGLLWRNMDLENKVYTVPLSKSGEALRLPMHSQMQEILKGLPRNGPYVFAGADGEPPWDFTHNFSQAAKSAGIQDLHLHDLRHTWASRLAMAGVDLLTIKELGGWKTIQMVQRYAHLSPDHKRQAIERLQVAATCSDQDVASPASVL